MVRLVSLLLIAGALAAFQHAVAQSPAPTYALVSDPGIASITTPEDRDQVMRLMSAHLEWWATTGPEQYPSAALLAVDVVFEYPYARDGKGVRLEGREAVTENLRTLSRTASRWYFHDLKLIETPYRDVFFIEYQATAFVPATNRTYEGRHIARVTVRDGKIADYYELWDRKARAMAFAATQR